MQIRLLLKQANGLGLKQMTKTQKWLGGNYSAMWWNRGGVWKMRSELFVTLKHY